MREIYVDGACKGNPGPGGFGVVILEDIPNWEISRSEKPPQRQEIFYAYKEHCVETTNNREELKAIIHAFDLALKYFRFETCIIYTDSAYCANICNNWIRTWAKNNWKNSKKETVENLDLVQTIYKYLNADFFNCQVAKTPGHSGILGNELADALASDNVKKMTRLIKENNLKIEIKNDIIFIE